MFPFCFRNLLSAYGCGPLPRFLHALALWRWCPEMSQVSLWRLSWKQQSVPFTGRMSTNVSCSHDERWVGKLLTHWPLEDLKIIFKLIPQDSSLGACCEIALRWLPQNLSNVESTLVQVMTWCRQATSHYLNQCWPRSLTSFSVTRPQCVNIITGT